MTGLEPEFKGNFKAPFVKNAPVQMSMKFIEEIYVPSNDVLLIVAEIKELFVKNELLEEDGFINLAKGKVATINGLDGYSIPNLKNRFSYQRPKVNPKKS